MLKIHVTVSQDVDILFDGILFSDEMMIHSKRHYKNLHFFYVFIFNELVRAADYRSKQ